MITEFVLTILFGLNMGLLWHRKFGAVGYGGAAGGSFLGVLVTGCPACSVSLASYLGLGSLFVAFPFIGVPLKLLGVGLLLISINSLSKDAKCRVK